MFGFGVLLLINLFDHVYSEFIFADRCRKITPFKCNVTEFIEICKAIYQVRRMFYKCLEINKCYLCFFPADKLENIDIKDHF